MRGLEDALDRMARRDELRERAGGGRGGAHRVERPAPPETPSVSPVVDEVTEALQSVVRRNPGVFATVVVQEADTAWSVWIGEWDGTLRTRVTRLEPDPPAVAAAEPRPPHDAAATPATTPAPAATDNGDTVPILVRAPAPAPAAIPVPAPAPAPAAIPVPAPAPAPAAIPVSAPTVPHPRAAPMPAAIPPPAPAPAPAPVPHPRPATGPAMNDRVAGRIAELLRREATRETRGVDA